MSTAPPSQHCGPSCRRTLRQLRRSSAMRSRNLTDDDYDEAQRAAWMASADDEESFAKRLAAQTTLLALRDGEPVGFVSLKGNDLHRHALCAAGSCRRRRRHVPRQRGRNAGARAQAKTLSVDASDTALPFFEKLGFKPQLRQSIALEGEWLAQYENGEDA